MIRLMLVDDQPHVRQGLRMRLALEPDVAVVGEAGDGAEAVTLAETERPDVVVMDVVMPGLDGIALALKASKDWPDMRILLMTGFAAERQRAHNLEALIHRVVPKPFTLAEICDAVDEALADGTA